MNTNTVNMNMRGLAPRELETAAGGTFNGNMYPTREYKSAGINVVRHFIEKDEFWWNGENIGHHNENAVTYYNITFGYQPPTVDNAVRFYESWLRTWREEQRAKRCA